MADTPNGPFTRWWESDGGWRFADFDTLKEAIEHQPYTSGPVIITKPVKWEAKEAPASVADYIDAKRAEFGSYPMPVPGAPAACNERKRLDGQPYPRTCQVCGLGPCRYGREAASAANG